LIASLNERNLSSSKEELQKQSRMPYGKKLKRKYEFRKKKLGKIL